VVEAEQRCACSGQALGGNSSVKPERKLMPDPPAPDDFFVFAYTRSSTIKRMRGVRFGVNPLNTFPRYLFSMPSEAIPFRMGASF